MVRSSFILIEVGIVAAEEMLIAYEPLSFEPLRVVGLVLVSVAVGITLLI